MPQCYNKTCWLNFFIFIIIPKLFIMFWQSIMIELIFNMSLEDNLKW